MNSRFSPENISEKIKAEAQRLGFSACGLACARPVGEPCAGAFRRWIAQGRHADMGYMADNEAKRLNPELLMPGVKTIVSLALSYAPARRMPSDTFQIAAYALGGDYHTLMKAKLHALAKAIQPLGGDAFAYRAFCDTAPVLERFWAQTAGIGWAGRNHLLVVPRAGTMFFLGELFLNVEAAPDKPMESRCGQCRKCIDACPTGALKAAGDFDASLCLSYQTIENRGPLSPQAAKNIGNTIYGCDRCQAACPHNAHAKPTDEPALQPSPALLSMTKADWQALTPDDFRRLFKGSAVKRTKYEGLTRNIQAAEGKLSTAEDSGE